MLDPHPDSTITTVSLCITRQQRFGCYRGKKSVQRPIHTVDPLSVAASVIALVQAGTGIAKAAKVLRGFTKARAEFCDFLNEITTLQAVVHDVQSSLSNLPQQKSQLPIAESTSLSRIVAELQDTTKALSELSDKLLAGSKGRGKDGLHRISKLQWQRSKAEIARLRDNTRSARESLSICFSTLQVAQGMELRGLVETFSSTYEQRHAESVARSERQHTTLVDTLSSTLEQRYPNAMDDWDEAGMTPLQWAINTANEAAIRFLISKGANVEKTDAFGFTPLHQALTCDHYAGLRIAKALLDAGCDPNARSCDGYAPVHKSRSYAMTKLLLASGADPNITNNSGKTALSCLAIGRMLLVDPADVPKVITALIAAGADINETDMHGNAPIMWTMGEYNCSHESDECRFKYFHEQGASLDVINNYQQTILHFASYGGQLKVVEYIRSIELAGVDPDKEDILSYTAADHLARVSDHTIETDLWERRPTRAETLSMEALLVETRERNWEQGLFLYSREDPILWNHHLQQKSEVEELWQEILEFCRSASRDDYDTEDEGSSMGDGDEVVSRDDNIYNDGEIDEDVESIPGDEEDNVGSGNDDEDDSSDDYDIDDDYDFDDYEPWHSREFEIATPQWLREEATDSTNTTAGPSNNDYAANEDVRGEPGTVDQSREESDDEYDVFFDAHQGDG
ncbi:Ankyrin repeat-containing domain protein [Rhypophila sp. PSN 637]